MKKGIERGICPVFNIRQTKPFVADKKDPLAFHSQFSVNNPLIWFQERPKNEWDARARPVDSGVLSFTVRGKRPFTDRELEQIKSTIITGARFVNTFKGLQGKGVSAATLHEAFTAYILFLRNEIAKRLRNKVQFGHFNLMGWVKNGREHQD